MSDDYLRDVHLLARRNPGIVVTFYPLQWRLGVFRISDTVSICIGPLSLLFTNELSR